MMIWKESTTKWFQIQNGGHNPSCLYKKILAGNLYCSPSPPHFVAEIWRWIVLSSPWSVLVWGTPRTPFLGRSSWERIIKTRWMQSLPMRLNSCDKYYGQFIPMFSNLEKKTVLTRIHHDYITWINMNQHGFTSCKKTSGFSLLHKRAFGFTKWLVPGNFTCLNFFSSTRHSLDQGNATEPLCTTPHLRDLLATCRKPRWQGEKKTSLVCKSSNRQNIIIIIIIVILIIIIIIEEEKRNIVYLVTAFMIRNPGSHIWSRRLRHFLRSNRHDPYFIGKLGNVSLIIRSA